MDDIFAVLSVDLDRVKQLNDSLGHVVGDRLLQSVARRLVASVRGSNTVSRQGGDEFVILLPEVARARDAAVTADKVLLALREPFRVDQHELHVTGSIGIVRYPDDGGMNARATGGQGCLRSAKGSTYTPLLQDERDGIARSTALFHTRQRVHTRQRANDRDCTT